MTARILEPTKALQMFVTLVASAWAGDGVAGDGEIMSPQSEQRIFQPMDVFALEYASDPQISPCGQEVVYVRNFMDVMKDEQRSSLWTIYSDGSHHRALTDGNQSASAPRWSPDGTRLVYASDSDGTTQLYLRWMDTGQTTRLTQLSHSASSITWSPDGGSLAFSMLVPEKSEPMAKLPAIPKGAKWAEPPKVIESLTYRFDGSGYLETGYRQLFVLSADGGTPRQLTFGRFHHDGPLAWTPDGQHLIFSTNRHDDWERDPVESQLYELTIETAELRTLTSRDGPDEEPSISPDGNHIAYVGYDDKLLGYENYQLYILDRRTDATRKLVTDFDRSVTAPTFAADGSGIYFQYDDQGTTKIGFATMDGKQTVVADNVGGTSLGRPYSSGSFSVGPAGSVAYTHSKHDHPAEVAVALRGGASAEVLTRLNDDLLGHKELAAFEEIWLTSKFDDRRVQAWLLKPPGFSPAKTYPLLLEIHGGPFANYGDRFTAEMQLYAAAGYVVLYVNPRGSTGYGHDFANLIHHNYPGQDYDDLMTAVDTVVARGYIENDRLYVTGGSGGGVLSAWIVGKTDRFRAAVVAKPVINWYSFALTTDAYNFFYKYWFSGVPWEHAEEYLRRSPISLVGNVKTPTMLLTGEEDYRTPISESEQFYQALKLRDVDTVLVRIPGASHSITARPSRLIAKVAHVLAWFEKYK